MSAVQTTFHIAKGESQLGPWTIEEIAHRLAQTEIAITDFVYLDAASDWVPLMEMSELKEHLRKSKPKAPPKTAAKTQPVVTLAEPVLTTNSTVATEDKQEWFVQKGQHRYGPFTYFGVVRALQEKTVYEFDLVWKEGMEHWIRLAEHELFTSEKIRALHVQHIKPPSVFIERQFARVKFEAEVIVNDNRSVWLGRTFEGGAGGSGLVIENATLVPGQTVVLHFASQDGLPAFNAVCEIVSKKFQTDVREVKSPVAYGVRFVKLESNAKTKVNEYFLNKTAN